MKLNVHYCSNIKGQIGETSLSIQKQYEHNNSKGHLIKKTFKKKINMKSKHLKTFLNGEL